MNNQISMAALAFRNHIKHLKERSHYYPDIYRMRTGSELWFSTLVRIERGGVWYVVHVVESYVPGRMSDEMILFRKMAESVYKVMFLYVITGEHEDVDNLQISETERLTKLQERNDPTSPAGSPTY